MISAILKKRVPLVSLNPPRFPAILKLWQGNPATRRSIASCGSPANDSVANATSLMNISGEKFLSKTRFTEASLSQAARCLKRMFKFSRHWIGASIPLHKVTTPNRRGGGCERLRLLKDMSLMPSSALIGHGPGANMSPGGLGKIWQVFNLGEGT